MRGPNAAHASTNPRERATDIIATGMNTSTEALNATLATEPQPESKLSKTLPPLVFGTATFNYQFNKDPYALHPNDLVRAALLKGVRAFDTSPYYGPAEEILGAALHSHVVTSDPILSSLRREDYHILTKCGRMPGKGDEFDYSDSWIRHSVQRSLKRLGTTYLDVVYLHDVEFVSAAEVLSGIQTLRTVRDESAGSIKHVGICGMPVDVLCELSEMILQETGEPLDIVQSYANYTVQNQRLLSRGLDRLQKAGVDVVANASPLGMGLLRTVGVPTGNSGGMWHPAPDGLRVKCAEAAQYVQEKHGDKLENVAVRFAMESWLDVGVGVGSKGVAPAEAIEQLTGKTRASPGTTEATRPRLGVNVMGVSRISELEDTMTVYSAILDDHASSEPSSETQHIKDITSHIRAHILGAEWTDYAWASPDPGFVNVRTHFGATDADRKELEELDSANVRRATEVKQIENDETSVPQVEDLKNASQIEIKELLDAVSESKTDDIGTVQEHEDVL